MVAGSSNSAAGVLTQLSEAFNSSCDEQDNVFDDTISIISCTSGSGSTSTSSMSKSTSEARDGDSSSTTTIDSTSTKAPSSLLSVLQQAKTSDLSRKRIIRNYLPPKGKKRKVSTGLSSNLKSVSPRDRCNQFFKEYFTVSGVMLFCGCCREEVSFKLSSIKITLILINTK